MENFHEWNWQRDKEYSDRAAGLAGEWRARVIGWLAIGNFGGIGLLATFATRFTDPVLVLSIIRPSLWALLVGGVCAGVAGWTVIERSNARSQQTRRRARLHYARYLAQKKNKPPRDQTSAETEIERLKTKADNMHTAMNVLIAVSALALVIGFLVPLLVITFAPSWFPVSDLSR